MTETTRSIDISMAAVSSKVSYVVAHIDDPHVFATGGEIDRFFRREVFSRHGAFVLLEAEKFDSRQLVSRGRSLTQAA